MVAATKNRNTPTRAGYSRGHAVKAGVIAYAGTIAVMGAGGFAEPGITATGLTALGRFDEFVDNSGGADGDKEVTISRGCFHFANSAGADEVVRADIGKLCYIVDNQTVAKTDATATRSVAGIVDGVDDTGVWVNIDPTNGVNA
ncbi:hypothetical protein [Marinobacter subterrani]|uniref:Uncharacterized protein n=1 Tax=Marinobacter subterrani TaxID=1658765 RepID=A0A0J7JA53_9GAMM|nr:hypothetical protein [Marinobacter subterrani]KMQ72816.1 hypothetical protein Msub_20010 [Marinobacter subterrani]KMQ75333.1 hypothetical protein Msub_11535 [Marinobacter subterrani]